MLFGMDRITNDKKLIIKILQGDFPFKIYGPKLTELFQCYKRLEFNRILDIEKKGQSHHFDEIEDILNLDEPETESYTGYILRSYVKSGIEDKFRSMVLTVVSEKHNFAENLGFRNDANGTLQMLNPIAEILAIMEVIVSLNSVATPLA